MNLRCFKILRLYSNSLNLSNAGETSFVQKVVSTIHRINLLPLDNATGFPNIFIHWIVIYPVDSAIQRFNNRSLELNSWGRHKVSKDKGEIVIMYSPR